MRPFQSLSSVLQLLVLFIFFGISIFMISLYFAENCRDLFAFILLEQPFVFFLFGLFLFTVTLLITISFATVYKPHYLSVKAAPFAVDIDTVILAKYLEQHLLIFFPDVEVHVQVFLSKHKPLEILLSTDKVLEVTKKESLKQLETEMGKILHERFDYNQPFTLTFSTLK